MEEFKLEIELVNSAFEETPMSELARILRALAEELEETGGPSNGESWELRDINGNRCGFARFEVEA